MHSLKDIEQAFSSRKAALTALSHQIFEHPEIRFQEFQASQWLCDHLEGYGFEVTRGWGSLPTAFKASFKGKVEGPKIAFLAEYDALEGLGHACGHNLIATIGVGAALALQPLMADLPGEIIVLGTPGEEGGGGKVIMLREGAFEGIDAALMIHPLHINLMGKTSLARVAWEVCYEGKPAHAAAAPHLGINALDAVRLAFNGMDALRQQVKQDVRMHAIIHQGGDVANVIPHQAGLKIYLRAAEKGYLYDSVLPRMRGVFEGAALMTGARVEIKEIAEPYDNIIVNETLGERFEVWARGWGSRLSPHPRHRHWFHRPRQYLPSHACPSRLPCH
ncbi:MAG: M20 family metallopeptidase [Deinococcales bacterium]